VYGSGKGYSKQEAAQEAARAALERFEDLAVQVDEDGVLANSDEE
jgi:dsRNA-specific ribonuclease